MNDLARKRSAVCFRSFFQSRQSNWINPHPQMRRFLRLLSHPIPRLVILFYNTQLVRVVQKVP
jgi:hypothetical protein